MRASCPRRSGVGEAFGGHGGFWSCARPLASERLDIIARAAGFALASSLWLTLGVLALAGAADTFTVV